MGWRKSRISAFSRPPSSIFRATASAGRPECRVEADARGRRFRAEGQHHEILGGIAGRGHRGTGAEAEAPVVAGVAEQHARSEEHTSELQSLMRISYAVFRLKKKNITEKIHK